MNTEIFYSGVVSQIFLFINTIVAWELLKIKNQDKARTWRKKDAYIYHANATETDTIPNLLIKNIDTLHSEQPNNSLKHTKGQSFKNDSTTRLNFSNSIK